MGMVPMNETFEIAILFATLLCLVLIVKRKLVGSLLYTYIARNLFWRRYNK